MKKTLAIIGATGQMGQCLSKALCNKSYRLVLMDRDEQKLEKLKNSIYKINPEADIDLSDCAIESSWESDIIILAVPHEVEADVARHIRQVCTQKILISIGGTATANHTGQNAVSEGSAAEQLQRELPRVHIVKAFNTLHLGDFKKASLGLKTNSYVAGDNEMAVEQVCKLVEDAGFYALNVGQLIQSRMLESLQVKKHLLAGVMHRHHKNSKNNTD
jgi:predicted dinucleotide-binding enzyme